MKQFLQLSKFSMGAFFLYTYSVCFWVFISIYQKLPKNSKIGPAYGLGYAIQSDWSTFLRIGTATAVIFMVINLGIAAYYYKKKNKNKMIYFKHFFAWLVLNFLLTISYTLGSFFVDILIVGRA